MYVLTAFFSLLGVLAEVFILSKLNLLDVTLEKLDNAVLWGAFFYFLFVLPAWTGKESSKYCQWITENERWHVILTPLVIILTTFFILLAQYT